MLSAWLAAMLSIAPSFADENDGVAVPSRAPGALVAVEAAPPAPSAGADLLVLQPRPAYSPDAAMRPPGVELGPGAVVASCPPDVPCSPLLSITFSAKPAAGGGIPPALASDARAWQLAAERETRTRRLAALNEALQRCWDFGVPLDGSGALLATAAERRAAILAFWAAQRDADADVNRQVVEAFLNYAVQPGADRVSAAEADAAAAACGCGARLTLRAIR